MVTGAKVLLLGITFKENCPDIRNTRVVDIVSELTHYHASIDVYDPWADASEVKEEYGIELIEKPESEKYDAVIAAVAHHQFKDWNADYLESLCKPNSIIFDLKYMLDRNVADMRL
jgi:UDP-N-acetyl-D-galactosamine dehydrogenase